MCSQLHATVKLRPDTSHFYILYLPAVKFSKGAGSNLLTIHRERVCVCERHTQVHNDQCVLCFVCRHSFIALYLIATVFILPCLIQVW